MIRDFDQANFHEVLRSQVPVVIVWWAPSSLPDHTNLLVVEGLSAEYPGVLFGRVQYDDNSTLAIRYRVSPPVIHVFKGGEVVSIRRGIQTVDRVIQ